MPRRPLTQEQLEAAQEAQKQFEKDLQVRGEAVEASKLPESPEATHQVRKVDGKTKVERARFKAA